jgi:hypothetical protein
MPRIAGFWGVRPALTINKTLKSGCFWLKSAKYLQFGSVNDVFGAIPGAVQSMALCDSRGRAAQRNGTRDPAHESRSTVFLLCRCAAGHVLDPGSGSACASPVRESQRFRLRPCGQHSHQVFVQISPCRIQLLDQRKFPDASPFFQGLFSGLCINDRRMLLMPDKNADVVAGAEPSECL